MVRIDRNDNFLELLLVIFLSRQPEHVSCFRNPLFLNQPAGTARNSKKEEQEEYGGKCREGPLPPPLCRTKRQRSPEEDSQIGKQKSRNPRLKEKTPQPAPPLKQR